MSVLTSIKNIGISSKSISPMQDGFETQWKFVNDGNGNNYFKYEGCNSSLTAYRKCPPLTAIVNKKAQAYVNGKTWLLNNAGKAKDKVARGEIADGITTLWSNPNPLQSGKQFEAQNYIYQQLAGYVIVLPIVAKGFPLYRATSLWNIPPQMLEIKERSFKPRLLNKVSDLIESITIVYQEERVPLDVDAVIIIKDVTPSFDSPVIPESRIKSLEMPINNIIGAYESRNVLINSRGPMYVISSNQGDESGRTPLNPTDRKQLQSDFASRYGLTKSQSTAIITNANINLATVGFSTKDLLLFEEVEGSTMALCDNFGYPYRLMGAEKSASYNDVSEFKKMLYQDTILPEAETNAEQWDAAFETIKYGFRFDKDFTHLPVLQEDKVKMGQARYQLNQALLIEWQNNMITWNEWRVMNGADPVTNMDIYYYEMVAQGKTFGTQPNINANNNASNSNK